MFQVSRHRLIPHAGELYAGFYFPTASFALLSMISFLIEPNVVSGCLTNKILFTIDNKKYIFFKKVPGRMGMVITLYLISANVYNSVEAPIGRGFSYIELWMLGTQFPILLALCEYGFILYLTKSNKKATQNPNSTKKICSKFGCCQGTRPLTVSSMNSRQSNDQSATGIDPNQILNHDEPKPDFEERIRNLDFATMIFSFIYFITFVLLYMTVL